MYVIRHDNEIINVRTLYLFKPDYVFQNDLALVGQIYFRVVGVADPYRVGAYNAIMPTTHGYGTNISCIFSNSPQSIVGCGNSTHRSADGGTERKPEQNDLSSTNETIKFSVTLARQRVVGVADPYRVGTHNVIMPITPRTRHEHFLHFLKFSAVHCRVRRLDAPLRRRRHRTQAGTKRFKQHKRNNKIFSDTYASKGRRGRRPLQGRCVQCNHADNAANKAQTFFTFSQILRSPL